MSTPMTVPNQFRISLCKTTCEEHCRLHMVAVAAGQQGLEPFLRSRHPVAIDGEVELLRVVKATSFAVVSAGMGSEIHEGSQSVVTSPSISTRSSFRQRSP